MRYTFRFYSLSFENSIQALLTVRPSCKWKTFKIPFSEHKTESTFNLKFTLKLKISAAETKSISIKSFTCIPSYYSMCECWLLQPMRREGIAIKWILLVSASIRHGERPYESNVIFNACFFACKIIKNTKPISFIAAVQKSHSEIVCACVCD